VSEAATAHYDAVTSEGDTCTVEPALSIDNLGTVGDRGSGFTGAAWRATAAETDASFDYGVVISGSNVAFVNLYVRSTDDEQIRTLLTRAGQRLGDLG
jgi:hypothetical protein